MVIIFAGEDTFRTRKALEELLNKEKSKGELRIQKFDAKEDNFKEKLRAFLEESTLWNERKIAIVKATSWNEEIFQISESDLLIFFLEKLPKITPKNAILKLFPILKGNQLLEWIRDSAKELGNEISYDLQISLLELYGSNTEAIWNELTILSCFRPGKRLNLDDLKELRTWIPHPKDFALVDALLNKNRKLALRLLHQSLLHGISPLSIAANIASHFRAMLMLKKADKVAKKFFEGKHPFWISKIRKYAAKFSEKEIKDFIKRLALFDYSIKTGRQQAEIALEELVLGI